MAPRVQAGKYATAAPPVKEVSAVAWKTMTPEQKRAYREQNLQQMEAHLEKGVEQLVTGEDWIAAMKFAGQFRSRSFLNTLLIHVQHVQAFDEGRVPTPTPSYVAGYTDWKKLGRWPAKGQTGYFVRKPVLERYASANPAGGKWRKLAPKEKPRAGETVREKIVNVTYGKVWDVAQTEGAEIPERPAPEPLTGKAPEGLWDGLAREVKRSGFKLLSAPDAAALDGADGLTDYTARQTHVRADMDDAERVLVLAHELGHIRLHDPDASGREPHRGIREVEAESVAAMICSVYGMDTGPAAIPYVAGWATTVKDMEPGEVIRHTGERVRRVSLDMLDRLPEPVVGDGKPPLPQGAPTPAKSPKPPERTRPAAAPELSEAVRR